MDGLGWDRAVEDALTPEPPQCSLGLDECQCIAENRRSS
jgi:hypothetical protein